MVRRSRAWPALAAAVLGLFAVSACSDGGEPASGATPQQPGVITATAPADPPRTSREPRRGGTLKVAQPGDPASCDLHMSRGMSYQAVHPCSPMLSQIIRAAAADHGELVPDLAIAWEVADDGVTWTFTIRQDAVWHDGSAVTAGDLLFSLQRIIEPPAGLAVGRSGPIGRYVADAGMVRAPDERTLSITTAFPAASFLANLASVYVSVYPRAITQSLAPPSMVRFDQVVGSGPFTAGSSVRASAYKMRRNDQYYEPGRPYLDELWYLVMPQPAVRLAALKAHQIDMIAIITEAEAQALETEYGERIVVLEAPSAGGNTVQMNARHAPFDQPGVRRAVNLAISRPDAARALGGGLVGAIMPPGGPWALAESRVADMPGMGDKVHEREEARRLLADAGLPNGFDVKLHTRANPFFESLASFAAGQLALIGIRAEVTAVEAVAYQDLLLRGEHSLIAHSHSFPLDDPDAILPAHYSCDGAENFPRICDPDLDRMIKKQSMELDPAARKALVDEIQLRVWNLDAKVWFQWSIRRTPVWSNVRGFAIGGPSLYQGRRMESVWLE